MDKRTLGCICDHGTTECKDIITLFESNRGYCGVYVCNKGLQEILRLTALNDGATTRFFGLRPLNDAMNCHCERSEAIQFLGRGMRILTGLPRKSDDFLAMTDNRNITKPMRNEQNGLVVMFSSAKYYEAQETKPDRCRNMIKKMRNEQNGLVVMFSSAKHHEAQETKPDRCRNMIRKEVA